HRVRGPPARALRRSGCGHPRGVRGADKARLLGRDAPGEPGPVRVPERSGVGLIALDLATGTVAAVPTDPADFDGPIAPLWRTPARHGRVVAVPDQRRGPQ